MNPHTGTFQPLGDLYRSEPDARLIDCGPTVEVFGTDDHIADVSAAVRTRHDPEVDFETARQRAMDELRALSKAERNRGRR